MLAELPDPSAFASVGWVLFSLGGLAMVLNQGWQFISNLRGKPENSELKGTADVITQRVAALEKESSEAIVRRRAMHGKIDDMEKRVRDEVKKDTADLHEKINAVDRSVAALNAKTELQNQQLARIESYVHRLAEKRS